MAKKKVKKVAARSSKKSHGELFDNHPNLIWLLPVFLIIAALAVVFIWKDTKPTAAEQYVNEKIMIDEDVEDVYDQAIDEVDEMEEVMLDQ